MSQTETPTRPGPSGACGGAWCEILDEDVGACEDCVQQRGVCLVLEIRDEALLSPVEPYEVAREMTDGAIIEAREVAFGALHLDHPRACVRESRRAVGRGDGLFDRQHQQALERRAQKDLGMPSTCSAT